MKNKNKRAASPPDHPSNKCFRIACTSPLAAPTLRNSTANAPERRRSECRKQQVSLGKGGRSHPRSCSFSKHNAQRRLRWGTLRLRVMFGDRADRLICRTHAVPAQTFQCSRREKGNKKTIRSYKDVNFPAAPVNVRKRIYSPAEANVCRCMRVALVVGVSRRTGLSEEPW